MTGEREQDRHNSGEDKGTGNCLREQYAEHSRVGINAVVFELPDQIVRGWSESKRHHGRRWFVLPRQVRMTEAAQIEVRR